LLWAVRYDTSEIKASMVIAKGKDHVALKAEVEIGQEIIEYVYRLKRKV
jgi:flagellar biosynthesis protein FlhB